MVVAQLLLAAASWGVRWPAGAVLLLLLLLLLLVVVSVGLTCVGWRQSTLSWRITCRHRLVGGGWLAATPHDRHIQDLRYPCSCVVRNQSPAVCSTPHTYHLVVIRATDMGEGVGEGVGEGLTGIGGRGGGGGGGGNPNPHKKCLTHCLYKFGVKPQAV